MQFSLKDIPVEEVLLQQQKWWKNKELPFTYEVLGQKYGSEKLVYKKMEQLSAKGLLEYGVSLRTAWLSKEGETFLEKLKE